MTITTVKLRNHQYLLQVCRSPTLLREPNVVFPVRNSLNFPTQCFWYQSRPCSYRIVDPDLKSLSKAVRTLLASMFGKTHARINKNFILEQIYHKDIHVTWHRLFSSIWLPRTRSANNNTQLYSYRIFVQLSFRVQLLWVPSSTQHVDSGTLKNVGKREPA